MQHPHTCVSGKISVHASATLQARRCHRRRGVISRRLELSVRQRIDLRRPEPYGSCVSWERNGRVGAEAFQEALRVTLPRSPGAKSASGASSAFRAAVSVTPPYALNRSDDDAHAPIGILIAEESRGLVAHSGFPRERASESRGRAP